MDGLFWFQIDPKNGKETLWRCVLVNQEKANLTVFAGTRWKVCHGIFYPDSL
jgi:hypothetical protein